jgi:hypothetical protein
MKYKLCGIINNAWPLESGFLLHGMALFRLLNSPVHKDSGLGVAAHNVWDEPLIKRKSNIVAK